MYDRDALLAATDLRALADDLLGPGKRSGRSAMWPCPSDQHAQTGPDLADRLLPDAHPGTRHSLHQTPHGAHPGPKTARSGHT